MQRLKLWAAVAACGMVSVSPTVVHAFPALGTSVGGDCTACHDQISTDRFETFNFAGQLDPPDGIGELNYFTVEAGQTATLSFRAVDGTVDYAYQLKGTDDGELSTGGSLIFLADTMWDEFFDDFTPTYFTSSRDPFDGWNWDTSDPREVDYAMDVNPAADPGVYLLTMSLVGRDRQRIGWTHAEQVYLEVTARPNAMDLTTNALTGGQRGELTASNCTPGGRVYFVYSTAGYGNTEVPQLGVRLGIENPTLAGSANADGSGVAVFSQNLPGAASGLNVWLQALEAGNVSNVAPRTIQ